MLWDTPAVRLCTFEDGATGTGTIGHNADDEPFNGLYACGDVAGSFYGHECPLRLPGGSIGRGFVFGVLSGGAMCGDLESTVG